ncbi:norsolorinic acid reductase [Curvularia clavata]|uniref:Norsolorinic acid reductase n=1 Tax=Curvularia clavata TaxID=95742 RepID=A0A9Q9DV07_CURCL|nr:norsolorinic acid reductase [Curvularia clavata]
MTHEKQIMDPKLIPLSDFRIPDYPSAPLTLNGAPLSIVDTTTLPSGNASNNGLSKITPAIGLATLLYKWHPHALTAFLDFDAWFSMTWTLTISPGDPSGSKIEIGRIGNQITFGSLDSSGENWKLMLTYNVVLEDEDDDVDVDADGEGGAGSEKSRKRGTWIPNTKESMIGERDVTSPALIERLAEKFVQKLVCERRWETGKGMKHAFCVEYAPMDVWGDGIPMSPHWLYKALDLSTCTACGVQGVELQRCGRCGTATYCSDKCQKGDWAVHKSVCQMSLEDRGQAIKLAEKGGLVRWDEEKTCAREEGEWSQIPYFEVKQRKRVRLVAQT